ncbi:MAG TPA: T9SS type A sorting domain-containing protein [Bacteroidetes bacterium]|nr:T9SS type A sorting domain-containing protein [Bacteroidota bacterium]
MRMIIFILTIFYISIGFGQIFNEDDKLYKIPCVVHVIYLDNSQLVSLNSVQDQISSLNQDLSKTNSDISLLSNTFQGISSVSGIELVLSNRAPDQTASTGITVNNTNQYEFTDHESPKKANASGVSPWDIKKYLNIWVCNLPDQDIGSAVQPWDDNLIDGIVINRKYFGINTDTVFNKGRVLTYLVGEWLGLNDISYGSNCPGAEYKTCVWEGDKICDTPPMDFDISNCIGDQVNTCTEESDLPDMLSNFMCLRADSCRLFFTKEQTEKMRIVLCSYKDNMLKNDQALSTFENKNIGLVNLIIDNDPCIDSAVLSLYVDQLGIDTIQNYVLNYQIDGGATISYQQIKTLAMYDKDTISIGLQNIGQGVHNIRFWVSTIDSYPDEYKYNDSISVSFFKYDTINTLSLPLLIDFEDDSLKYTYSFNNSDNDLTWAHTFDLPGKDSLPTKAIMINHYRYSGNANEDVFLTPPVHISGLDSPKLFFDLAYAKFSSFNYERLILSLKRGCFGLDSVLLDKSGSALQTVYNSKSYDWYPEANDWKRYLIDLKAFESETFQLEFKVINGYGNNLFLDNILITDTILPNNVSETSISDILIYPNPVKDILYIDKGLSRITEYTIFNMMGESLVIKVGGDINEVDFSDLKSGLYFLELRTEQLSITYKISHFK